MQAWERLSSESPQAWEAFSLYRDLGKKRTAQKVSDELQKSYTLIARWSSEFEWPKRALAFDRHIDEASVDAYKEQVKGIVKQQTQLADKLLRHLDTRLDDDIKAKRDPSMRWTTAFSAATKVQGGAMDMVKDKSDQTTDTVLAIERIIARLSGDDE